MSRLAEPTAEVDYPSSDGEPMAETTLHVRAIVLFHQALEDFFAGRPDVFIASDIFWYWEEGNIKSRVAPDTLVALGVEPKPLGERNSYLQWRENGVVPSLVFETASAGTWRDDLGDKFELYESLGVSEYILFDPAAEYLVPALQGYRLRGSAYRRMRTTNDELASELGFRLRAEGEQMRLIDGRTNRPILTRSEQVEEAQRQVAQAQRQVAEAQHQLTEVQQRATEELARQAAEIARLKTMVGEQ